MREGRDVADSRQRNSCYLTPIPFPVFHPPHSKNEIRKTTIGTTKDDVGFRTDLPCFPEDHDG